MVKYPPSPLGPWITEYLPLSALILMVAPLGIIHLDSTVVALSGKSASISHVRELPIVNSDDGCVEFIGVTVKVDPTSPVNVKHMNTKIRLRTFIFLAVLSRL
jgi:hypothetical protein